MNVHAAEAIDLYIDQLFANQELAFGENVAEERVDLFPRAVDVAEYNELERILDLREELAREPRYPI